MATVLHVTQPTDAGVGVYVEALAVDQAARGWRVVVACPDHGRLPTTLARAGIAHHTWAAVRAPNGRTVAESVQLRQIVRGVRPDVVHLHSSKAGLAGRLALRGRVPTLFQPHGWSWLAAAGATAAASLSWERFATRWTTLAVCVGEGEASLARRRGVRGPSTVVRSGVDLNRFRVAGDADRRAARAALGLPRSAPIAVCVGRVTRQKGQDLLAAAWPAVRVAHPSAVLAVVGDGSLPAPVPPGVRLAGATDDPWAWYAAADVVVFPSRWEGLPLTLLEALATGRSVVGSDIPGIAEVLPACAGAVVPLGDVRALADAVARRLSDADVARHEGAAARAFAEREADIRRTHDHLAALIDHEVSRAPTRRS